MSGFTDTMAAYHELSPRDLSFISNYHNQHQRQGIRPDPFAIDYGTIAHQRQWMMYAALRLIIVYDYGTDIVSNMVTSAFWDYPDPQLPQEISQIWTYPNNLLAAQANPFFTPEATRKARKCYWTGKPRHRRNL